MAEAVTRVSLLEQTLEDEIKATIAVRRITMQANTESGPHTHNGPVYGSIEVGSAVLQLAGGKARVLHVGDVFYEPAETVVERFDATAEGVTFLAYFLTAMHSKAELTLLK